mmetsp:Transcript_68923/g.183623  ORF Transcript_68923/g.183623 Transcript_68923/m.183623 type:complete len:160 (-) Transcript_68923:177-656(-)
MTALKDISYTTVSHLNESWDALRRIENYEVVTGTILFQKFFTDCPKGKTLFGFNANIEPSSPLILKSRRFLMHASYFVQMIDTSLTMLGPGVEILTEIMTELGEKHARMGVESEMYPIMCEALVYAIERATGESFSSASRKAWKEFFAGISNSMIQAGK